MNNDVITSLVAVGQGRDKPSYLYQTACTNCINKYKHMQIARDNRIKIKLYCIYAIGFISYKFLI